MTDTMNRACPNCAAVYNVVRMEVGPDDKIGEIRCLVCGGPLQGGEGKFIYKYLLISNRKDRRRRVVEGSPPARRCGDQ